ncbi:hypothetical protein Ait01nite_027810 [Actinoplanes italicus]|uniref:Uncharacterized protein n=1 Tax=Actinoplanes italicus TaxID=113567 RepID=A0A2T0KEN9_9ACTN|nr:hypothetical protein [Actinoplanes italicus]PRX21847.1 hypothetical protein CLV67_10524 [Actinoplanes italicus]GIE29736.1 hypothetical protein Ait01nite_027810 [Actinoplanes italicus]
MTTSLDVRQADAVSVTPVAVGGREIGAWITGPSGTYYRPVIDVTWLAGAVLAATATVAVAATVVAARPRPAIGQVTMGPGGWVSLRGLPRPRPQPEAPRPWWAHLLRAHRFTGSR